MRISHALKARFELGIYGQRRIGRYYRPTLHNLSVSGVPIYCDLTEALGRYGIASGTPIPAGFKDKGDLNQIFPDDYGSELNTVKALWTLITGTRPEAVVETGVANGQSTRAMLLAMEKIGFGHLYSFDIDERILNSVEDSLRARWSPIILPKTKTMKHLESHVAGIKEKIGIWYHDSDHSYHWQISEFDLAKRSLTRNGFLVSDDVDGNDSFADFAKSNPDMTCTGLFDRRKVCGLASSTRDPA
ncbi:MAG: class I SAM-dependent methyltransferase [Candidatus Nanopelagicales bacterium]|nr:class I SAM-dependent methyltransferase [Candidatus Nanopelagicales bacterium]